MQRTSLQRTQISLNKIVIPKTTQISLRSGRKGQFQRREVHRFKLDIKRQKELIPKQIVKINQQIEILKGTTDPFLSPGTDFDEINSVGSNIF